jgi:hypothetical protein
MGEMAITVPDLDRLRGARSIRAVSMTLTDDQFVDFQVFFKTVTGTDADPHDEREANGDNVAATLECVRSAVDILNRILVLRPGAEAADRARCEAILQLLQDRATLQTSADRWTPLQRVLIDLARTGVAHFGGLPQRDGGRRLVVLPAPSA